MKYLPLILRLLLGIPLAVFGIFGLVMVMPDPQAAWESQEGFTPEAAELIILMWNGGLMIAAAIAHLVTGVLLISNRYVPLALAIHLPVSLMMTIFHLFLDVGTGAMAFAILALNLYLIYKYWDHYQCLFKAKVTL